MKITLFLTTGYIESRSNSTMILSSDREWDAAETALQGFVDLLELYIKDHHETWRSEARFCQFTGAALRPAKDQRQLAMHELICLLHRGTSDDQPGELWELMDNNGWQFVSVPSRDSVWLHVEEYAETVLPLMSNLGPHEEVYYHGKPNNAVKVVK